MPPINVTVQGIFKLLKNLNPSKASGPDKIPCRLLVLTAHEIAPALTHLFSLSLKTGDIPEAWRHALVQPVFKKGDRSSAANYRPISLTSVICKLLEHVIRSGMTAHFDKHNILVTTQHGFRKNRSCESQLILTIDDLASTLDEGGQTDTILLDFSKAFDKVPHRRLLLKLEYYGIRGNTLLWIKNFLSNRTQQVVVEGEMSSIGQVTSGVPQGSVLGPTLFLAYINDISNNISSKVRLFADDTILYRQINSPSDCRILQRDLQQLEFWEQTWQMDFNASKCHVLSVSKKKKPIVSTYILHGEQLQQVNSAKYLGVEISQDLSWSKHINNITSKANKTSAFVHRNLRGCPHQVQAKCYKTLVRPVLEYSSSVWDPSQQCLITNLEMVQRRAARRILHDFQPTTSASALVAKLELDPLSLRRKSTKATMLYKITNSLVDSTPERPWLTPAPRQLRGHGKKFLNPSCRTNILKHSFFPSAIRLWNEAPAEAVNASTPQAFKSIIEGWLRRA